MISPIVAQIRRHLLGGAEAGHRSQAGFTVIELTVAAALMIGVLGALTDSLMSITNTSIRGEALVANEQTASAAITQLGRDLRSASFLTTLSTTAAYSNEVEMTEVSLSGGTGPTLAWVFDPNAKTLSREILVNGVATSTNVTMNRVLNTSAQPPFGYFSRTNTDLVSAGATASTVSLCTTRVEVHLFSAADPGPVPFQETQDIQLRNQLANLAAQGNNPC